MIINHMQLSITVILPYMYIVDVGLYKIYVTLIATIVRSDDMPTNKMPFTFHIAECHLAKMKYIAKSEHRSLSNMLEYLCMQCIEKYEKEHGRITMEMLEESSM